MGREISREESPEAESRVRLGVARRKWRPTVITAIIALAAQACGMVTDDPKPGEGAGTGGNANTDTGGTANTSPNGGDANTGAGGNANSGVGGILIAVPVGGSGSTTGSSGACAVDDTLLLDQTVGQIGSQRVFYSWTTDDQVAELRAGGALFSRSESPGKGRGLVFTQLAAYAAAGMNAENLLASQLESVVFAKARFSWTNPWATLLGWPGETYGNQLLQIELKPEAWIAFFNAQGLTVRDAQNQTVAIETALATPERIGAIYFQSSADSSSGYCGTFSQGAVAFREFVLGNLQMVQRWSLATAEITQRLNSDITRLQAFEAEVACLRVDPQADWSSQLICSWFGERSSGGDLLSNYDYSLGIPSELYYPTPDNIAALIAALQMSLPTGNPLIVNPSG
jgi:hypothetical protein